MPAMGIAERPEGRTLRSFTAAIIASGLLAGCAGGAVSEMPGTGSGTDHRGRHPHDTYSVSNAIPPRLQWNENFGYCGEVSVISAGLYYGQYLSQYDARAIASNNRPQYQSKSQLLVGVNDTSAATKMHLTYAEWTTSSETSTNQFLAWVKSEAIAGYPVAIGIYTNEYLFYGDTNLTAGDPDYDHIVPVTGISSNSPLTNANTYYANDVITFNDNGLWTGTNNGQPQYVFSYPFGTFEASRKQANAQSGNIYSLTNDGRNYAIAITGVVDLDRETVPVRVATSVNYESPDIKNGSTTRPAPMPLTLTITVSGLVPGAAYNLYRYNAMSGVPNSAFNANAASASQKWAFVASGTTYVTAQNIESNEEAIYRAVPASAP